MRKTRITRWILFASAAGVIMALALILGPGRTTRASSALNLVYVESNVSQTPNQNSIFGWSNDGAGNLTALSGSPYLTGGTGVLGQPPVLSPGFQADAEMAVDVSINSILAVNAHSNTIAVMKFNSDGSLTPVTGSPFASSGQEPVSLAVANSSPAGNLLTVVNQAADPNQSGGVPNYTTFQIGPAGKLIPVSGSTVSLTTGSVPAAAYVNATARYVFTVQFMNGGLLTAYAIGKGGKLVQTGSMKPAAGNVILGAASNPKFQTVYVGLPDVNSIGIYTYNSLGQLTFQRDIADSGNLVCWLAVNSEATRLYAAETGTNSITVYDISSNNLNPTMLQHLSLNSTNTGALTNIQLDPTEKFLYALGAQLPNEGLFGNALHVLTVQSDGTLVEVNTPVAIPEPSGEEPMGIAVRQILHP